MRPGLELTGIIEKYLRNELSAEDKAAFEQRMSTNAELKKEVELQREIMQGIQRAALKQKVQNAWKQYRSGQNFLKWGLSSIIVLAVAAATMFFITNADSNALPELNENGEKLWADADKYLPSQKFTIDTHKDTILVSQAGIVFAVPANCFLDANGHPVNGKIEVEIKEAMDALSLTTAGLSTKSGDKLLETGGMFYLNARQDGNSLTVDKSKGIYAEVPTDKAKEGMMLFEGKRKPDGSIDWQDPKPLEKFLTPVDISSLNFYPPEYLDSLEGMGYDITDKKFTDSLYYSFSWKIYSADEADVMEKKMFREMDSLFNRAGVTADDSVGSDAVYFDRDKKSKGGPFAEYDMLQASDAEDVINTQSEAYYRIGINPAKVQAIWNSDFDNTLIATREFGMRMRYIHRTCSEEVLELYVNNLDKKLCTIDSMAAAIGGSQAGKFREFAARGDGRVEKPAPHINKLKEYYAKRAKAVAEAIVQTRQKFLDGQAALNKEAFDRHSVQSEKELQREADNISTEFQHNLKDALKQLGLEKQPLVIPPADVYRVTITNTGWKNIDQYVMESVQNRATLDYTDPQTGKKAVIEYKPLTVNVNDPGTFDRLYVYLLPEQLNSFMRMEGKAGKYNENLNTIMKYKLFCIGYKEDEVYVYSPTLVYPDQSMTVSLVKTDNATVSSMLNTSQLGNSTQQQALIEDVAFHKFERSEMKRKEMLRQKEELARRIEPVIFPCDGVDCAPGDRNVDNGMKLFKQNCAVCHSTGTNVITGPGLGGMLTRIRSKQWFVDFTRNADAMKKSGDPYAVKIDRDFPSANMNVFNFLSDREIEDIYEFLACKGSQPAPAPAPVNN